MTAGPCVLMLLTQQFLQEDDKEPAMDVPAKAEPLPSTTVGDAALPHQPEAPEASAAEQSKVEQATPKIADTQSAPTAAPLPTAATLSSASKDSLNKPCGKKRQVNFLPNYLWYVNMSCVHNGALSWS